MAQGMVWAGIAATFAMAVGTALTVSAIAIFSVSAKGLALRLAAGSSGEGSVLAARGIEALAGLAVLAFGLMLMIGLLSSGSPLG
jgi:ABC-type nickel/cobalt efflux system permease component RcnA